MTQKELLKEAWLTIINCRSYASSIVDECGEYSSTAAAYARHIMDVCDRYKELDKPKRKRKC